MQNSTSRDQTATMTKSSQEIPADFLRRLAAVAAEETLPRFRVRGAVSNKEAIGFDPVTEADRQAERAIRELIGTEFPDHGILGEEHGSHNASGRHVWIIDPIDGTRAFISGVPVWGTLVGFTEGGRAVAGLMSQPFTGELYFANHTGAHYEGPGGARPLKTSATTRLEDSILFTTTPALFKGPARIRYDALEASVRLARYGVDCYAFAMVASGNIDIAVDAGLQAYDIAALVPIIEKAGGVVTTFDGGRPEGGGDIVAAATPELHEAARAILAG